MSVDLLNYLYNGLLRFTPLKKYFEYLSDQRGNFPLIGLLTEENKKKLEQILGVNINNIAIFEQALIHRSYLTVINDKRVFSNERLEFLGDAVLGMVIAEYLFSLHTHFPEGELTKMRSWLVNSSSLAISAKKLNLEKFLLLSYSAERSLNQGSNSILADAMEAIIGAIFVDSGFDAAKKFIVNSLIPIEMNNSVMQDDNFKSILLEYVQAEGYQAPLYKILDEEGPDHNKTFTIGVFIGDELITKAKGKNKKQAEQFAAKKALKMKFQF